MATDVARSNIPIPAARSDPAHQAFLLLRTVFTVAPILFGQDKFANRVPYFFTDQYDLGMEFAGWFPRGGYDALITRADLQTRAFYAFWLTDERVLAGMHVDQWDEGIALVQDLLRSGRPVDRHRLADPAVPLADTTTS